MYIMDMNNKKNAMVSKKKINADKEDIIDMLWKIINKLEEDVDMEDYQKEIIEFNKLMLYLYLLMVSDQKSLAQKQKKIEESIENINKKIKEIKANSIQLDKDHKFAQIIKELIPMMPKEQRKPLESLHKKIQTLPKTS